ncbi:MAG: hypothetical protein ACRDRI_09670 [Pseudonocardiaceae bacterium]
MVRLVWLGDEPSAESPSAPGWVMATGLAARGHELSWIDRDNRRPPHSSGGVRLCPFPYDERDWPPGEGLRWGLVRLLGREVPLDLLIAAGADAAAMARRVIAERGLDAQVVRWHPGSAWVPLPGADWELPVPVPVPEPSGRLDAAAAGGLAGRLVVGALGCPANRLPSALGALGLDRAARPDRPPPRWVALHGRDALWRMAATFTEGAAEEITDGERAPLWADGLRVDRLWRLLAGGGAYLSVGTGFDLAAALAALAGMPVLLPAGSVLEPLTGRGYRDGSDLAQWLITRSAPPVIRTALERLRAEHVGDNVVERWHEALVPVREPQRAGSGR